MVSILLRMCYTVPVNRSEPITISIYSDTNTDAFYHRLIGPGVQLHVVATLQLTAH